MLNLDGDLDRCNRGVLGRLAARREHEPDDEPAGPPNGCPGFTGILFVNLPGQDDPWFRPRHIDYNVRASGNWFQKNQR